MSKNQEMDHLLLPVMLRCKDKGGNYCNSVCNNLAHREFWRVIGNSKNRNE